MSSLEKAVRDIRGFKVQGANQIAVYGLEFLREYAKKEGFKLKFETAAYFLEEARPTAVVLHNCIEVLKRRRSVSTIDSLIKQIKAAGHRESAYADRIVKPGSRIMTYCHSGEAMSFIRHVWGKHRKSISVIACRTEPLEQGVKTAKELAALKIPVTLIDDNAADFFMKDVDMVVVGADALREEGFVNKIGTAMLAKSAKSRGKPFYVVANTLKVDRRRKLKIEERPAGEIYSKITNNRNMRRVKIRNPAFDVTPWKYVTAVVTEKGVMKPPALVRRFL